jgi:putative addiction module component (TIGR02574 family)
MMTKTDIQQSALALSPEDRLEIAETLLVSLDAKDLPLYSWQETILDARIAAADADPQAASTWPEMRARIEARLKRAR